VLYGVTFYDHQLLRLDPATGGAALITNFAEPFRLQDVAAWDHRLYVLTASNLVREVDPGTGRILREFAGRQDWGGEGAMAFRADGLLFVSASQGAVGTLASFNLSSLKLSLITAVDALQPSLDGLAWNAQGRLYGLRQGSAPALYTVDPQTGTTALVGSFGQSFPQATLGGLAFGPDGTLYAVLGSSLESRLYKVDPATGSALFIGAIGLPGLSGIAFCVPPPGPLLIQHEPAQLTLSWPTVNGGQLLAAPDLAGPWLPLDLPSATNDTQTLIQVPGQDTMQFFRLVRP
jgi:hypothetical protein